MYEAADDTLSDVKAYDKHRKDVRDFKLWLAQRTWPKIPVHRHSRRFDSASQVEGALYFCIVVSG